MAICPRVLRLTLGAAVWLAATCDDRRVQAAFITYEFSGSVHSPDSKWGLPTQSMLSGHITWDTTTSDSLSSIADTGAYNYSYPYGRPGMSVTTENGLTFSNRTDMGSASFSMATVVQGANHSQDRIDFSVGRAKIPSAVPADYVQLGLQLQGAFDGSLLNGSDAIPQQLPAFTSYAYPASIYDTALSIAFYNFLGPGAPTLTGKASGVLESLRHRSTEDSTAVGSGGAPTQISLAGGSSVTGGVLADVTASSGGTFNASYSSLDRSQLPNTAAFSSSNFFLDIPGERLQVWDLGFTGILSAPATVSFRFDPLLLTSADRPGIWHFRDGTGWEFLGGTINGHTITVVTDSFSPFAMANSPALSSTAPEPGGFVLFATGALLAYFRFRNKGTRNRSRRTSAD